MSIHDRDYYREEKDERFRFGSLGPRPLLIGAAVLGFLVQMGVENAGYFHFLRSHFYLSLRHVLAGEIWQPFTYMLLHVDPMHLFMNMLGLYFFGSVVEQFLAKGGVIRLYLLGGLGGAAGCLLWSAAGLPGGSRPVIGASGAVTAILAWAALRAPKTPFLLFFFLPVPLWVLGAGYVGMDVFAAVRGGGGDVAVQAHLGGAVVGALLYLKPWERGRRGRRAAATAVPRGIPSVPVPDYPPQELLRDPREEERVDALLDRIHASGIESLTEEEREFLKTVSRRYGRTPRGG